MAAKWPPKYSILSFLFFPCLIGTPNIFSQSFTLAAVATFEKPLWGPTKLVGIAAVITGKCTYILCFARMHLFLGCTLCTVQGISTCRSLRQPHLMRGVATALSNSKDLQSRKLLLKRKEKKKSVEVSDSSPTFFSQLCTLIVLHFFLCLQLLHTSSTVRLVFVKKLLHSCRILKCIDVQYLCLSRGFPCCIMFL